MPDGAVLSDDGRYRYLLTRSIPQVFEPSGAVTFVMLNPSTADATTDDATIRKCKGFAERWGYSELRVVNVFAFRATDPRDLARSIAADGVPAAIGPENGRHMWAACEDAARVVCAWGAWARKLLGVEPVRLAACDLYCLGTTKDGSPRHPGRLGYDTPLETWRAGGNR